LGIKLNPITIRAAEAGRYKSSIRHRLLQTLSAFYRKLVMQLGSKLAPSDAYTSPTGDLLIDGTGFLSSHKARNCGSW
jgi:hypothetical protein